VLFVHFHKSDVLLLLLQPDWHNSEDLRHNSRLLRLQQRHLRLILRHLQCHSDLKKNKEMLFIEIITDTNPLIN
jgi:hypothetical protein